MEVFLWLGFQTAAGVSHWAFFISVVKQIADRISSSVQDSREIAKSLILPRKRPASRICEIRFKSAPSRRVSIESAATGSSASRVVQRLVFENNFKLLEEKCMSTSSNPLDAIPDEIPFDVPYGPPISLDRAQAVIHAAVAEAKKRNWKTNIAVADSGGNLVAFQRMDDAMLASIQIAEHKARAAATFRRETKVFEDGIQLMHLQMDEQQIGELAFICCQSGGSTSEPLRSVFASDIHTP
jgi:uncharacterized protein GlcG (DUF336 family)